MGSILHQGRHHSLLGSSWSLVQPVLRHGCHRDSFFGKGNANAVPPLGVLPERGRNLLRTASFGQIHGGSTSRSCTTRDLPRHDISWKRTAFRGISMSVRRPGTLLANEGRECRATATVLLAFVKRCPADRPAKPCADSIIRGCLD